jgi:hypothetical protein
MGGTSCESADPHPSPPPFRGREDAELLPMTQ